MNEVSTLTSLKAPPDVSNDVPHSIEAEQQLLGALLTNNDLYDRISAVIKPHHFYDPVHARIFEIASARIATNKLASPVTLKAFLAEDEGLSELGGASYLIKLAGAAISTFAVRDYAEMIYDLAIRRELISLGNDIAAKASSVNVESEPKEQIVEAEQQLYDLAEQGNSNQGFQSFLNAVTDAIKVANAAYKRDGGLAGVATGLTDLDKKLGGLHQSDLLILAGRPSMGKTSLATNIAFNAAKHIQDSGKKSSIAFFSLEMSSEQLSTRILSEQARISSNDIRRGRISDEQFDQFLETSKNIAELPLFIDETPAISIAAMSNRARRIKRLHGLDMVVVDYIQLMRGTTYNKDGRVQEISQITQGLKAIAKELGVPVLALSQLSRQVEQRDNHQPQLADLRESGSIEQDADVVMFVYREGYYLERLKPREATVEHAEWQAKMNEVAHLAEIIIGKQRHGPIGKVTLEFEERFTKFKDTQNI